jgi:hypothetical protein
VKARLGAERAWLSISDPRLQALYRCTTVLSAHPRSQHTGRPHAANLAIDGPRSILCFHSTPALNGRGSSSCTKVTSVHWRAASLRSWRIRYRRSLLSRCNAVHSTQREKTVVNPAMLGSQHYRQICDFDPVIPTAGMQTVLPRRARDGSGNERSV